MDEMRAELGQQRKGNKHLEKELELVKLERDNFEELYRDTIAEQKVLLQT